MPQASPRKNRQPTVEPPQQAERRDAGDQVIDLSVLAAHATDLADSLERAWSDALSPEALGAAHEELNARFNSLLVSIQRQVAAGEHALREAGVNTKLGSFPPSLEEIGQLSFEPDPNQRWLQTQMAQIDALALLLEALNLLRRP